MKFEDWIASLDPFNRNLHLLTLYQTKAKRPLYVVTIGNVCRHSIEYANIVGWLEEHNTNDWCEFGIDNWTNVDMIGLQDVAIAAEFKLIFGQ